MPETNLVIALSRSPWVTAPRSRCFLVQVVCLSGKRKQGGEFWPHLTSWSSCQLSSTQRLLLNSHTLVSGHCYNISFLLRVFSFIILWTTNFQYLCTFAVVWGANFAHFFDNRSLPKDFCKLLGIFDIEKDSFSSHKWPNLDILASNFGIPTDVYGIILWCSTQIGSVGNWSSVPKKLIYSKWD